MLAETLNAHATPIGLAQSPGAVPQHHRGVTLGARVERDGGGHCTGVGPTQAGEHPFHIEECRKLLERGAETGGARDLRSANQVVQRGGLDVRRISWGTVWVGHHVVNRSSSHTKYQGLQANYAYLCGCAYA